MENWFKDVGKTVLLEALGGACDEINNRFKTDLDAYNQDKLIELTTELDALRQKAAQVNLLENENDNLRDEIKALKEAGHERSRALNTTSHQAGLRTPLAPKSINQLNSKQLSKDDNKSLNYSELQSEYSRIDKKYAKLHERFLDLHEALNKSNNLLRERTALYRQWVDHAEELGEQSQKRAQRIKRLEGKLAELCQEPLNLSFSSNAGSVATAPVSTISASSPPRRLEQSDQAATALSDSTLESSDLTKTNEVAISLPPLPRDREVTDGGYHIKSEPSSDTPVVVSERSVGKRKYPGNNESSMPAPRRVKIESSPELQDRIGSRRLTPHESIDFDTEFRRVETPRKHTRQQALDIQVDHEDDNRGLNNADAQEQDHAGTVIAHDFPDQHDNCESASDAAATSHTPQVRSNSASGYKNGKSSTPRGLASLAEVDYPIPTTTSSSKQRHRGSVLGKLLDTPLQRQRIRPSDQGRSVQDGQPSNFDFQPPRRRELPFGKDGRIRETSSPKPRSNISNPGPVFEPMNIENTTKTITSKAEKRARGGALRHIPKDKLRPEDFRINPDANEGYDYAFTDVVRRKDDRACLQGCVKENCCGQKFRALARASRASTRQDEFHRLLETYLGDNCHQLSTMSEAEKETLWIEAKMRELANATGRHRHRYARMTTPPGFWRTDFPSTQEGEEYNEEAAKLLREIVDERYREAMRPGGLWVFRDE